MKSVKGSISSKNENIPEYLPTLPLYIRIIKRLDIGAQITSENSPINGTEKESIPIISNTILKNKSLFLVSDAN